MILLGSHDRDALGFRCFGEPEVHVELRSHVLGEITLECIPGGRQTRKVKDRALHEGATGLLGRVLVQRHDVRAGTRQKSADRSDQTRSVGAAQQQPADVLGG